MTLLGKILSLLFLGCSVTAYARLGEAIEQVNSLYGTPLEVISAGSGGLEVRKYLFDGLNAEVQFVNQKSVQELFYKRGKEPLSKEEMMKLLDLNSGSSDWQQVHGMLHDGAKHFKRADDGAWAKYHHLYQKKSGEFIFCSKEHPAYKDFIPKNLSLAN